MLLKAVAGCARPLRVFFFSVAAILAGGCLFAAGQSRVHSRIPRTVNPNMVTPMPGTVNPRAKPEFDIGQANSSRQLTGMTIYFKPSTTQQAELETLLKQQQTPGSPLYHKWITPAQYADRFGLSTSDLEKVEGWLERQGFSIDRVANSRDAITFSGTVGQAESAFRTQIHQYRIHGATHFANANAISIPSAFAGVVLSVGGISNFRPHPLHRLRRRTAVSPQYTFNSGAGRFYFLAPDDLATIYDLNPLYAGGYTGSGQTIVVVGQSAIATSDITNFQKAAGLTQKAPKITLVPNTGASVRDDSKGDEDESDLDVEWSGAVARGATINFVYVGSSQQASVFDAMEYAIDNNLGSIISISYGACEIKFSSGDVTALNNKFKQANLQGQTIVAAAGDNGATDCESDTNSDQATQGLAVDLPASSPYVTGIGGTEFAGDVSAPGTYWNSSNGAGGGSAIQFIPEKVWNDTSPASGIQAGGGGASALFGKPSWQSGAGVPKDGKRDVPDLSLNASPDHDGYLYCASGADTNSCSNGFLDGKQGTPTVAGGTSFGSPIFSGILAILTQKLGSGRLGNVNPQIYSLAASHYSSAFHDTTSGNNAIPCTAGSTDCKSSPIGYSAGPGYDLASGWGSIDAANFVGAFTASTSDATTTVLTASNSAPVVNSAVTLTATVTDNSGGTTPAGSIQFVIDGANAGGAVALSNGVATTSYTPSAAGSHSIVANYAPSNSSSAASSGTLILAVSASASSSGSLQLAATDVTVKQGGSGTSTVTITSTPSKFSGAVSLSVSAPGSLTNACFAYTNPTMSAKGSVTIFTSKGACAAIGSGGEVAASRDSGGTSGGGWPVGALSGSALAALLFCGLPGFRRRRWPVLGAVFFLAMLGLGASGCGSSPGPSANSNATTSSSSAPTGKYTLTLTGTDSTLNVSAKTTFTLTVD